MSEERKDFLTEPDATFLVEASAGTGKTRRLLERIIFLIEQGHLDSMKGLVAITFTEKAASELRNKLRQRIEDRLRDSAGTERDRLSNMLLEFEQAEISTIHAFCARLLRLRPVEAKVSPSFQVMDETESGYLFDRVWEKWLEELLETRPEFFEKLRAADIGLEDLRVLAEKLFENRDLFRENFKNLTSSKSAIGFDEAEKEIRAIGEQIRAKKLKVAELEKAVGSIASFLEEICDSGENRERIWYQVNYSDAKKGKWTTAESITLKKKFVGIIEELRSARLSEILKELGGFFGRVKDEKGRLEKLDFQDLLFKARDLVKENREARNYFKNRFQYILVDEFQDTDPAQVELVFFLSEDDKSFAKSWPEVKLKPGKLFLVGDPKQSIYRFRRADLEIYEQAKDKVRMSPSGREAVLEENFRSDPGLLTWVNATFQGLFPNLPANKGFQPAYKELKPGQQTPPLPVLQDPLKEPVVLVELTKTPEMKPGRNGIGVEDIRAAEARAIADFIQWGIGRIQVWERDGKKFRTRPAAARDFAILYPKHKEAQLVIESLRSRNLPFSIEASSEFPRRDEIAGLRSVLAALLNPFDHLALVGALRSLFLAVNDAELLDYHLETGSWDWLGIEPDAQKHEAVADAFAFLNRLEAERDRKGIGWILEQLIRRSQLRELRQLHPQFNQALLNLERIRSAARGFESEPGAGLSEFMEWLESLEKQGASRWPELMAEAGRDAIKLMTFHKSKGLEFPIVILANLSSWMPRSDSLLIKHWPSNDLAVSVKGFQTENYDRLSEIEERHTEFQNLRNLYVAATRAKQYLVIPDHRSLNQGKRQYLMQLVAGLEDEPELEALIFRKPAPFFQPGVEKPVRTRLESFLELKPAETAIEKETAKFAAQDAEHRARATGHVPISAPSKEEPFEEMEPEREIARRRALDIGALVHRVVELAARMELPEARKLARRLAKESGLERDLEEVEELLTTFWKSEVRVELLNHPSWQEVPFLIEDDGKLWRGKIDLVIRSKDGLHLVDLKTDRIQPGEAARNNEKYQMQMKIYRRALERLKDQKVADSSILYLKPGVRSKI